jgi:outer membrane lipoprotein carrier protein
VSLAAGANEAVLNDFFSKLKTFEAQFTQNVENAQFNSLEQSQGKLYVERPGKFRWDYQQPYEQIIVSDGKKVQIYDVDLEQVTVRNLGKTAGNTPALLLSSNQNLSEVFNVAQFIGEDDLDWFELLPKDKDANFTAIHLAFENKTLKQMKLLDSLGQTTILEFSNSTINKPINSKLFDFTPPEGVDVFNAE